MWSRSLRSSPGGCGDNGEKKVSAGELKSRLLPPSQVHGFTLYRPFEWDNSIDLVVQGIPMPEATPPSDGVHAADDAGFEVGAAEELRTLKQPPGITIEALKLKSHKGAERLLDFVHNEGLKLPCYASCGELPSDMPVPGIPGAQGIQQVPQPDSPSDTSPFVAYGVGFRSATTCISSAELGHPARSRRASSSTSRKRNTST